jgi:hypothetical protein
VEVSDVISDRHGWVREGRLGQVDAPVWASKLDAVRGAESRGRIDAWNGGWSFNSQVSLVASGTGEDGGEWFVTQDGELIPTEVLRTPRSPNRFHAGKWIDADLQQPVLLTAYEDDRPIYVALAVKGRPSYPTPVGNHSILRRVANERMRSASFGRPGLYDITGVLFTQYFTGDGAALHYNYWRSNWGGTGSFGCLGMNYDDSKFFWDWASVGTPVITHN